jgi:hypothetical protein
VGLYLLITSGVITRHNMDVFHILN